MIKVSSLLFMFLFIELGIILYYIQLIGILLNQSYNLIMIIIAIELLILSLVLIFVNLSYILDDILGNFITLILLPLSGCESALALMIFIQFYPIRGSLYLK